MYSLDIRGYGCEDCGVYYRFEKDLNVHLEKHCTKYCDEFSPKNILEENMHRVTVLIICDSDIMLLLQQ